MVRSSLIPLVISWEALLNRVVECVINEDNEATIKIIKAGYSQQLRHVQKTHRISISLMHDICVKDPNMSLIHIDSERQRGDILTKGLDRIKHVAALELANLHEH